jgi:hypothetical protein
MIIFCLIVWVGIMCDRAGSRINAVSIILLGGENISFDVSLVMYINRALGALCQMYVELEDYHTW